MKKIKIFRTITIALLSLVLNSCEVTYTSDASNKLIIEIRTIGNVNEKFAQSEIQNLLMGAELKSGFKVPIIEVNDITYKLDSNQKMSSKILVPLSSADASALQLTDNILDQSTYEGNLEISSFIKNDISYSKSVKLFSKFRESQILKSKLPSNINTNEFFVCNSGVCKTDTSKHIFNSSKSVIEYIQTSNKDFDNIVLFYLGDKSPNSLKDSDGDGVMDDVDRCKEKGSVECNGCICPTTNKNPPPPSNGQTGPTPPPSNCGTCGDLNLKVNSSNTKKISWNSCPSARFIYVYVKSSSGKISKSVKLNGNSTQYDLSDLLGVVSPDVAMMDKFTITIKAECGSGRIIQTSSQSKIKIKCS